MCRASRTPRSVTTRIFYLQGFTDPEKFDPDRFSEARREDVAFGRNFLTFGFGPHACVGREYAINHLVCLRGSLVRSGSGAGAQSVY